MKTEVFQGICHAILGSSDLDQEEGLFAKCKAWMISRMISGMFRKSRDCNLADRGTDSQSL